MNDIYFSGRLTRDAEFKSFQSGRMLASICVANNRNYQKNDGTMGNEVTYLDVDIYGKNFDHARPLLVKGNPLTIKGRLRNDTWTDQSGKTHSKLGAVCSLFDVTFNQIPSYSVNQQGGGMDGGGYQQAPQGQMMPPFQPAPQPQYQPQMQPQGGYGMPQDGYQQNQYPTQQQYAQPQAAPEQYQPESQAAQPQPPPNDGTPF